MWGGVKKRQQFGDVFRRWSATKGLEELRASLYTEPRPWYIAYELHRRRHLLQDQHCARLVGWCTTVMQLRESAASKAEAYRYAQETFRMLSSAHKAGKGALLEYMRLCAEGRDLTSAFRWFQLWLTEGRDGADDALLDLYAWLLRIAALTPSDESAEDMAVAVKDAYFARFGPSAGSSEGTPQAHFQPTNEAERAQLHGVFCAFKALLPRVQDDELRQFLESLPVSTAEVEAWGRRGWPTTSHHRVFPQLEERQAQVRSTIATPRLRDSLLHPVFLNKLQQAAFQHDVSTVVKLLQTYQERVGEEKRLQSSQQSHASRPPRRHGPDDELWRQYADASARRFRASLVQQGGLTPELYHYLVVALAATQPTAALRTLQRMREANLRVLDLTRAAVLVAVRGSPTDQMTLFKEQLEEIGHRAALDADLDTQKVVEHYWKYQYTDFFHYRNALDHEAFYGFLMDGIGPVKVQQLVSEAEIHGIGVEAADLVVLDSSLRRAAASFFRRQTSADAVQSALDAITAHFPKLDLSLIGAVPHFEDYTLADGDSIATDLPALRAVVKPYSNVYVLDTSFVETSEGFLSLGLRSPSGAAATATTQGEEQPLVLIPFQTLSQLATSVSRQTTGDFVSFDPALQEAIRSEPFLASQRLRGLFAMQARSSFQSRDRRRVRVVHFTEMLMANGVVPTDTLAQLQLDPATSDNDQLVLLMALVRNLASPGARVVLCSDDPALSEKMNGPAKMLFSQPVEILTTQPPERVDVEQGLINDNPTFTLEETFEPRLSAPAAAYRHMKPAAVLDPSVAETFAGAALLAMGMEEEENGQHSERKAREPIAEPTGAAVCLMAESSQAVESPWLSMLSEDNEETTPAVLVGTAAEQPPPFLSSSSPHRDETVALQEAAQLTETRERLMNLYESPHDVIPIGVKMEEASALGSIFEQFDATEPDEFGTRLADNQAQRSALRPTSSTGRDGAPRPRRRGALEKEMLSHQGLSNKERLRLARRLSNTVGGRVPFHMRYRVVEADINDPRNQRLRRQYEEGLAKKREYFKRHRHPR